MKKLVKNMVFAAAVAFSAVSVSAQPISVNGSRIDGNAYDKGTTVMLPVRSIAEELGFEVNWDSENKSVSLADMPRYVTFTIGIDGYTFARTAPMPLGQAPEIKDGIAYVPAELFTELLNMNVENGKEVTITSNDAEDAEESAEEGENAAEADSSDNMEADNTENADNAENDAESEMEENEVIVTGSVKQADENSILIEDEELGEIILAPSKETKITDADGNDIVFADIAVGDIVTAELGDASTLSLPPINNPVYITLLK